VENSDFLIIYAAGYLEDSGPDNYFILGSNMYQSAAGGSIFDIFSSGNSVSESRRKTGVSDSASKTWRDVIESLWTEKVTGKSTNNDGGWQGRTSTASFSTHPNWLVLCL